MRRTAPRIALLALAAAALAAAWALFAPPQLGGSTRYVILDGTSMEPSLSAGDLAIIRTSRDVESGDVVLYEHPRLEVGVLHRIVRQSGGRFVLKGDNNDFLDDARPRDADVQGELWFAVPRLGSALTWIREPTHAALIVFVLAFVALGGVAAFSSRRRPNGSLGTAPEVAQPVLAVALGAVVAFGLLVAVSFSRAPTALTEMSEAYAHTGTFRYGATVEESDVYPDGVVDTGEPAFLQLVSTLDVGFTYRLDARDAEDVRGTAALTALLSDGTGWMRTLPVGEPVSFVGATADLTGRLDLDELVRIVEELKTLTGSGTSTFAVTVSADMDVRGRIGDERVSPGFEPKFQLTLDPVSLRPETTGGDPAQFTVRRAEALAVPQPATLALGGLRLSVADARRFALLGLVLAVVAALLAGASMRRRGEDAAPARIASRLGDRLVTLSRPPSSDDGRVTQLEDATSLVQVAEHYDRVVLHWREGEADVYEVGDGTSTFRLRVGAVGSAPRPRPVPDEDTLVLPRRAVG
ncbi:MAG TPA: signal peptidase I [Gaiellaceae bacterium]|nr:signal peptidase I [Gaiellaceae bacterium]